MFNLLRISAPIVRNLNRNLRFAPNYNTASVACHFHNSLTRKTGSANDDEVVNFRDIDISNVVVDSSRAVTAPSSLDREKELFALKRSLSAQYSKGNYDMALRIAVQLLEKAEELYGKKNAVYASCLNNIALMQKMLGEYDLAMNRYIEALHVYDDVQGKKSASYASTLSNLGALYRLKAAESTGMAKHQNYMRADEALTDSWKLRQELLGTNHRDTITSEILLAGLRRSQGKPEEALQILHRTLNTAKEQFSNDDILVATIENNLGLTYKDMKDFDKARECYINASLIRNKILGESHPESIVVLHNLAECLHSMGREKEAIALQEKLLSFVEVVDGGSNAGNGSSEAQADGAASPQPAPATPHPHAHLNINDSPSSFSSSPPKRAAASKESQYKPASRKRR